MDLGGLDGRAGSERVGWAEGKRGGGGEGEGETYAPSILPHSAQFVLGFGGIVTVIQGVRTWSLAGSAESGFRFVDRMLSYARAVLLLCCARCG